MSKEFISGLIELYRSFPCLWEITNKDYRNKKLKRVAYAKLVEYGKKFEKECTVVDIKQKIQNLRTTFRKEVKKVEDSKRRGSGVGDVYRPRLWYYDLLTFTKDDEVPQPSMKSIRTKNPSSNDNKEAEEMVGIDEETKEESQERHNYSTGTPNIPKPPRKPTQSSTQKRKLMPKNEEEFLATCPETLKNLSSGNTICRDEYDGMTINWAGKLRKLPEMQSVLAEDLINQVLKKAYFGQLTTSTTIHDSPLHIASPSIPGISYFSPTPSPCVPDNAGSHDGSSSDLCEISPYKKEK